MLRYWLLAGGLIVLGYFVLFSVGPLLFVMGVALTLLAPYRKHPPTFWPPIVGIFFFFAAFMLIAPYPCTTTGTETPTLEPREILTSSQEGIERTTCHRGLLPDYSGEGEPSLWPSTVAAAAIGLMTTVTARYLLVRQARDAA